MAETLSPTYKLFKGLSINASELYRESVQFLQEKFKTKGASFTLASPFGQLLIVLHNLTELILFYIEDSITELNIYEATRPSSVYSLAALSGHNPSRALSAVGTILIKPGQKPDFSKIPGNKLIFTKFMNLNCENNGLNYVLEMAGDETRLDMNGGTGLQFTIRQGRLQQQTFGSSGQPFQSLQLGYPNNFLIDQFLVNIYVNGERWENYQSILDIPRNGNGYIAKTGITNGLDIFFGNGAFGNIPPNGAEIIVEYLITEGSVGNISTDALGELVFTFTDTALNTLGEEITLSDMITVTCLNAPNFGTDPESLVLTRQLAPKTSKNFALVNIENYEVLMKKLQMFSSVRVTLDPDDNRVINIFLVPDITRVFTKDTDYFTLIENKFKLTSFQKTELLKYIKKSGTELISTTVRLLDPTPQKYALNISLVTFADFDKDSIKGQIINQVAAYFINNTRKDRIPKSDLIKLVEGISGVDSVSIQIIGEANEKAASRRTAANPNPPLVGLDEFNDIIIKANEFAIIRGGFTDRAGTVYQSGLSDDKLCAINVFFREETRLN
jgi:hypothetical protein